MSALHAGFLASARSALSRRRDRCAQHKAGGEAYIVTTKDATITGGLTNMEDNMDFGQEWS